MIDPILVLMLYRDIAMILYMITRIKFITKLIPSFLLSV